MPMRGLKNLAYFITNVIVNFSILNGKCGNQTSQTSSISTIVLSSLCVKFAQIGKKSSGMRCNFNVSRSKASLRKAANWVNFCQFYFPVSRIGKSAFSCNVRFSGCLRTSYTWTNIIELKVYLMTATYQKLHYKRKTRKNGITSSVYSHGCYKISIKLNLQSWKLQIARITRSK